MKRILLLTGITIASLLYSCSKSNPTPSNNNTGNSGTGGTTGNNNGYVVKTIGVSRILIGLDNNFKITIAKIYGGGNNIILKAGSGNGMQIVGGNITVLPDGFNPDGTLTSGSSIIDNSNPPKDTTGASGAVIKLTGFDKQKTGYNQLNLVMQNFVWAQDLGSAGYHTNLTYLTFNRAVGVKNSSYASAFISNVFSGNINVSSVEIAASSKPYITEDQVIFTGQTVFDIKNTNKTTSIDLQSPTYRVNFGTSSGINFGGPLRWEWVNADNGTVENQGGPGGVYIARFSNIKTGGDDQVVDPVDSTNKVFLRITGFDPSITGFNQLRLFIASDGYSGTDGEVQMFYNTTTAPAPSLDFIKQAYLGTGLNCLEARPQWPHY